MIQNENRMNSNQKKKDKIRERYKGVNPEELEIQPARRQTDVFDDDVFKRVAVYARVSTDDPRQTSSYELQKNYYMDMVGRHPNWELVDIYPDEGISGTSLKKRDAFNRMIADCRAGKIDLIVTKSVSRFARNIVDCISIVRQLAALNPPVEVFFETEHINTLNDKTLVIFISQSGETADSLKALDVANKTSKTLGIVNVAGSAITRRADYVIQTQAGPEIGVAATKTYVAQLTAIYLLAAVLSKNVELLNELDKVPDFIDEVLLSVDLVKDLSKRYNYASDFFYLGRGYSYPTALEGALKLKEITYIHGEGYAAGELKHGPLALIDEGIPVVVIIPPGDNYRKTMSNLEEVKSRGANVLAIGSDDDESLKAKADAVIAINSEVKEIIAPLVYIVPLQLIAYYITLEKGHDPDKPKNLAKCVTVE